MPLLAPSPVRRWQESWGWGPQAGGTRRIQGDVLVPELVAVTARGTLAP